MLRDGGSRVIVFSAFDNCLALLAATFEAAGVRAVRCEGDAAARHAAIAAFSGTAPPATPAAVAPAAVAPPPRVLLLRLGLGLGMGLGLANPNLTLSLT